MERLRIALRLLFGTLWLFIIGGVMQVVGAIAFFKHTLNSSIWGLNGYAWFILGLLLLIIGVLWTASKRIIDLRGENKVLDIDIEPIIRHSTSGKVRIVEFKLTNKEDSAITHCVAQITEFEQLAERRQSITLPAHLSFVGDAGIITIQRQGFVTLRLAKRIKGESGFVLIEHPNEVPRRFGENKITIKINGQVNGVDRIPEKIIGRLRMYEGEELEFVHEEETK